MPITFVGTGTAFNSNSFASTFTLNKPAGVVADDVMVAMVAFYAYAPLTVTCTGWTVLQTGYGNASASNQVQVTMLVRRATGSEPSSWTANTSASVEGRVAAVTAYRGVQTVGPSGQTGGVAATARTTATVNSTVAGAWRVVQGAYVHSSTSAIISSNETTRRTYTQAEKVAYGWVQAAVWDSNGSTVAVGNTSRTVSRSTAWWASATTIMLLYPSVGTPASGAVAMTVPKVGMSVDSLAVNPATVSMTTPSVGMSSDGLGQPIPSTGPLVMGIPAVTASVAASRTVVGTLDTVLAIRADVHGETQPHGVRVIPVGAESRVIKVESRKVAD